MQQLNFKKLTLENKEQLENFTNRFLPYSDFSFLSIYTYNTSESVVYCVANDCLMIRFEDYLSGDSFYSLLGDTNITKSVESLLTLSESEKLTPCLKLIPDIVIDSDPGLGRFFEIREDRDNFDYIVSSDDLAELSGVKFPRKRKLVDKFKQSYPNYSVSLIDLARMKNRQDMLAMFDKWGKINHKDREAISTERKAINRLLDSSRHFPNLHALGIYHNGKLIAFNTFDIVSRDYGFSSFQKADKNYEGIYAFLTHELAKRMVELGCQYINFEQDLGIEGLRSSKAAWHPVRFLKKYTISAKPKPD